ncbi:phosphate transporter permease [Salmonella enterica subsp. enterica]|nr:phosphate transporter permease [Salmonella enterica subsp. enterica]
MAATKPAFNPPGKKGDMIFSALVKLAALIVLLMLGGIIVSLIISSWPSIQKFGFSFLWTKEWDAPNDIYGALVPIYGTLVTSFIALLIAVPVSFGIALFLTELAPGWLKRPLGIAIELLAAIPSIVYGMWGLFIFAPLFATYFQEPVGNILSNIPFVGALFSGPAFGIGILAAGVILAIMIIPYIAAVMRDVFEQTPVMMKESAYGIGCTTWEVIWRIVLPFTKNGVIGGIMLGLGRALGETMAVTFIIGNTYQLDSASLYMPGNSITSALANEFAEAESGLHVAALMELGLILFVITFIVLAASKFMIMASGEERGSTLMATLDMQNTAQLAESRRKMQARRRMKNRIALTLSMATMAFGLFWLIWILMSTITRGIDGMSLALFTEMTPPPNTAGGGLANALAGSGLLILWATVLGTPLGIMAGIYLAEYGRKSWLAEIIRFINDILLSAPSIVVGLFVYTIVVAQMQHFSGWAGVIALALLQVPIVIRTTENMLKLVPDSLREAAYALGTPKWKMISAITLKASISGIMTGILLAIARIAGETAPLLFTALSNQFWSTDMMQPIANLPVTIFKFAMSPFAEWQQLAWAGVLIITLCVLLLNILARVVFAKKKHG